MSDFIISEAGSEEHTLCLKCAYQNVCREAIFCKPLAKFLWGFGLFLHNEQASSKQGLPTPIALVSTLPILK